MKPVRNALLACSLALFAIPACGDDEHDVPPECEEIAELCHDSTTAEGQECHENAEEVWSAAECTANEAACLAECAPEE